MKIPSSGGDFQSPEPGTYAAVCIRVIDLGTQQNEYEGQVSHKHQVLLQFELHGESLTTDANGYMLDENRQPDPNRPLLQGAWLTVSFHEEATLRKYMESWRGKTFTQDELLNYEVKGFDWSKMLGVPCMVKIGLNTKGKVKIQSVDRLQKNIEAPSPVNETYLFDMEAFDPAVFEKLSDGLKDVIRKSPEYQRLGNTQPPALEEPVEFDGDEVPF